MYHPTNSLLDFNLENFCLILIYISGSGCSKGGYSAIHWINLYPVDNTIGFANAYLLDSDLSDE